MGFNNFVYYFKSKGVSKNFISFKGLLMFYKNIKDGYSKLEKTKVKSKKINQVQMKQ